MAKEPEKRYESVRQLLEDIEQLYVEESSDTSDIRQPPTSWLAEPGDGTSPVAAIYEEEVDHGMQADMRLRREDLDDFEKQIRRHRSIRIVAIPLLLAAGAGAAAYYFFLRPEQPNKGEIEPNNELAEASLIAPGSDVKGFIGKRVNTTTPDRDFYRLTEAPDARGSDVVSVTATAPPNVNISLDLYSASGSLLRHVDEAGVGGTETLRRWRAKSAVVVSVGGVPADQAGVLPTENVSDAYALRVILAPTDERLESEPNDSRADATMITPGTPLTAHLDTRDDVDVFRIAGEGGSYNFLISGGPSTPFEWRVGEAGEWRTDLKGTVALEAGQTIALRHKPGGAPDMSVEAPYTIDLRRAP